jgi:hypothetical protein
MIYVRSIPAEEARVKYRDCKWDILQHAPDATSLLEYLAAEDIRVDFVEPAGFSAAFQQKAEAGFLAILDKHIALDDRKSTSDLAKDLAHCARLMMQAPKPNALELFLFRHMGCTFGRFMKLEMKALDPK